MSQSRKQIQYYTIPVNNVKLLIAFALAGVWAGTIVAFSLVQRNADFQVPLNVEMSQEAARDRFQFRKPEARPEAPRTQEYDEESAPEFQVPPPVTPETAPPTQPEVAPTTEPKNEIEDIFKSIKSLFSGEGSFQDIIKLVMAGFAIFGGGKFAASDGLFKFILALFYKKSNFAEIIDEQLKTSGGTRRQRRSTRRR